MTHILCDVPSPSQAKKTAIATVSQILDASEDVFQKAAEMDNSKSFSK
jgi:G protein-coupled receptor 128